MNLRPIRHLLAVLGAATLLLGQAALAGPGYSTTGVVTTPVNAPKVAAAFAKLNEAAIMKETKSRRMLLANVADGANPATHTFVVVFPSLAHAESFQQKLANDPAWTEFLATMSELATGADTMRFQTLRSFGDVSDGDVVWRNFAFRVTNPPAFAAAQERFFASATGKSFPGQAHLVAVAAGGVSPVTHGIVVGWASEAEAEAWNDKNANNPEWIAFLSELDLSSEFMGALASRTLAAYGPSLASTLAR